MDNYTEQILNSKPSTLRMLSWVGSIAVIAIGVFLLMFVSFGGGLAVVVIGGVLTAYTKGIQDIEYEYLFVNGDCDIACITAKSSRKQVYSFVEGDVLRILPYDSEKCQNELSVNRELTIKDYTSGEADKRDCWYAFFVNANKGTHAVVLELNEKSLNQVITCYKQKVEK